MHTAQPALNALNQSVALSLIAINQYFLHAKILNYQGFCGLGSMLYKRSIHMMKECDRLSERLLLLETTPNLQDMGQLKIGDTVPQILANDLDLENRHISALRKGIDACEQVQDFVSRDILQHFLQNSEDYADELTTQQSLINEIGLNNYLQTIMAK
ncbi:MAG: bacterioferritin [Neisseriaceae bacterium]|nr:bacterioferritin [Neisseriaceae bacterium]